MTDTAETFVTYNGDDQRPQFTVYRDAANTIPLDISTVQEIQLTAQRDPNATIVLLKLMSEGQIQFVDGGTDGQFFAILDAGDTSGLAGFYFFTVRITDEAGEISTVTTGRWQVGPTPVWTYSGDPTNSKRDAVRAHIGDIDPSYPLLDDPQIDLCLSTYGTPLSAAAGAARMIAAKYSRKVTKRVGDITLNWSDLSKQFAALADVLQDQANTHSGARVFAGGTSRSAMKANLLNPDRPKSPFWLWQFTNRGGYWGGNYPANLGLPEE